MVIQTETDDLLDIIRKAKNIKPTVPAKMGFVVYENALMFYDRMNEKERDKTKKELYQKSRHEYALTEVEESYRNQLDNYK